MVEEIICQEFRLKNIDETENYFLNDTQREKLYFSQFSTRMTTWPPLTFFICLHNQLNSLHSIITY